MTKQKLEELLPCPFCGGEAVSDICSTTSVFGLPKGAKREFEVFIRCLNENCCFGPVHGSDATPAWNTRASTTREVELQATVKSMEITNLALGGKAKALEFDLANCREVNADCWKAREAEFEERVLSLLRALKTTHQTSLALGAKAKGLELELSTWKKHANCVGNTST